MFSGFCVQKREKRRWIFGKPTNLQETVTQQTQQAPPPTNTTTAHVPVSTEQKHALAVAVATAEAAMATAQAAVEVARLTRPTYQPKQHYAAIVIQTAFRGYLVSESIDLKLCLVHQNVKEKKLINGWV